MGGLWWNSQPAPASIHRLFGYRVEFPADVPTREEQRVVSMPGMFKAVNVDQDSRVCTVTPAEAVLARSKNLVGLPETDYFTDIYPDP